MRTSNTVSPLRQRMIEDMTARNLGRHSQRSHIYSCKRFAAFLKRSPDTATADDVRQFQLHLVEASSRFTLPLPTLRRPPDHHRDLRPRYAANLLAFAHPDQDRYLMIPLPPASRKAVHLPAGHPPTTSQPTQSPAASSAPAVFSPILRLPTPARAHTSYLYRRAESVLASFPATVNPPKSP